MESLPRSVLSFSQAKRKNKSPGVNARECLAQEQKNKSCISKPVRWEGFFIFENMLESLCALIENKKKTLKKKEYHSLNVYVSYEQDKSSKIVQISLYHNSSTH